MFIDSCRIIHEAGPSRRKQPISSTSSEYVVLGGSFARSSQRSLIGKWFISRVVQFES